MRVAVVGCGVAGLAAGLALHRKGHRVTVFEAFERPQPVGSGFLMQPSGLVALRALGLDEPALAAGARVHRLDGRDERGRTPMLMSYDAWRPGAFGLGLHRAALFDILFGAAQAEGLEIVTGSPVTDIEDWSRPRLHDALGRAYGPFDMAVVADGSASRLRDLVRPGARAPLYPWGAVWANATDPEGAFAGALHQRYDRAEIMIGILPIGRRPGAASDEVSFFWSVRVAELDAFLAGDLTAWRARVAAIWPQAQPILDQLTGPEVFAKATYRDVSIGSWRRGAVVIIGDAAHGTSPQLGQGANLALVDAVELAERVDAPARLAAFQRARRRQTAPYQLMSKALTPLFQSSGGWGPFVRTWLFAPLSRTPGLRRLAAIVLTGVFRLGPTPRRLKP